MNTIKVVEANFALVTTENSTSGWIIDGDDVIERANKRYDSNYYGGSSKVIKSGLHGFGLVFENDCAGFVVAGEHFYKTRESAESALARITK